MRIGASCGRAPKTASLQDTVASISLKAETEGERQWLAGLLKALERVDWMWAARSRAIVPELVIKAADAPQTTDD